LPVNGDAQQIYQPIRHPTAPTAGTRGAQMEYFRQSENDDQAS